MLKGSRALIWDRFWPWSRPPGAPLEHDARLHEVEGRREEGRDPAGNRAAGHRPGPNVRDLDAVGV